MNFDITASRTTHVPEPSRCPEVLTVNTNDRVHRDAPIIIHFICIALFRELKDTLQGSKKKKKVNQNSGYIGISRNQQHHFIGHAHILYINSSF